jgi:hypothetical protein
VFKVVYEKKVEESVRRMPKAHAISFRKLVQAQQGIEIEVIYAGSRESSPYV